MSSPLKATPEGTSRYFERTRPAFSPRPLGQTGLMISSVGFGGYRITDESATHHDALRQALYSGCNLIDTSTNYTDGGSERLVGDVLAELVSAKRLTRDEVVLVTKAGYVQGSNLELARQRIADGKPFPEMVEYDPACWHCISPSFLEEQLTRSLDRLQLEHIDVLLLHNPEYFLKSEGDHREYYRRIRMAFEYLETEVERGRISHYGISSNTFPSPRESEQYTSLESVWEIAEEIGKVRGSHHFAVIQFPFNLFEPGAALEENNSGKSLLEYAREKKLGTLINRPLNAFTEKGLFRLSDFPHHDERDIAGELKGAWSRAMAMESAYPKLTPNPPVPPARVAWGHILRQNFERLQDIDTWKGTLKFQIQPSLSEAFTELERVPALRNWASEYADVTRELFDAFQAYLENQASYQSDLLSSKLDHACPELHVSETLSQKVIRLYLSIPGVDCVLVGMRQSSYVENALSLKAPVPAREALQALRIAQS